MPRPASAVGRIEGAFNRCIMRIAQALKDPSTYGDSTKAFIQECALQFHDSLDDCEVQILDAKWYLEHQLAQNKARREARAREEEGLAAQKRKLDQMHDQGEAGTREECSKRVKLDAPGEKSAPKPAEKIPETTEEPKLEANQEPTAASQHPNSDYPDGGPPKAANEPSSNKPEPDQSDAAPSKPPIEGATQSPKPTAQTQAQPSPQPQPGVTTASTESATATATAATATATAATATADKSAAATADPQPTPLVTPALTNDEFNFVSMFQDPSQDGPTNSDAINNDDLNFDLDLGNDLTTTAANRGGGGQTQNVGDTNDLRAGGGARAGDLDGLGLEDFVNQSQNQNQSQQIEGSAGASGASGGGGGGGGGTSTSNPSAPNNDNTNTNTDPNPKLEDMSFDLPPLDGPNEFDALFNEAGFDTGGLTDMDPDGTLSNEALNIESLDFDSMFS